MKKLSISSCIIISLVMFFFMGGCSNSSSDSVEVNNSIDNNWFSQGYGLFQHVITFEDEDETVLNTLVDNYDIETISNQLVQVKAKWFFITFGQTRWVNWPNDHWEDYLQNENYCANRDLLFELSDELSKNDIKLGVYFALKSYDDLVNEELGWNMVTDEPTEIYKEKIVNIIKEMSETYGAKINAWWFDHAGINHGYPDPNINDEYQIAYYNAAKSGNNDVYVAFNLGGQFAYSENYIFPDFMDYLAGHGSSELSPTPETREVFGVNWHQLTFLGHNWNQRDVRFEIEDWQDYIRQITTVGAAITLDVGSGSHEVMYGETDAGQFTGSISDAQMDYLIEISSLFED